MREKLNLVTAYRRATIWTGAPGGHMTGAEGAKAFEKIVIGPCTLARTWGTRLLWSENEIRLGPSQT
jgi:hypothetical protein